MPRSPRPSACPPSNILPGPRDSVTYPLQSPRFMSPISVIRLGVAMLAALASGIATAQPSTRVKLAAEGLPEAALFLKYSGLSTMRHFGVAIGQDGFMYVLGGDTAAVGRDGYVSRVTAAGGERRFAAFKSTFVGPGVDIDDKGNLYIAGGDKIIKVGVTGGVDVLASGFHGAFDLRLGPKGGLYVADHREGRIYRLTPSLGKTLIVDYHLGPGEFLIGGIAFDKGDAHLYSFEAARKTLWRYPMKVDGTAGAAEVVVADAPPIFSFDLDVAGNVFGADFDRGEVVEIGNDRTVSYVTAHCGLKHPIGFRLGTGAFHPGTAFIADDDGIKQVRLPVR